jgi:hypothetical protein
LDIATDKGGDNDEIGEPQVWPAILHNENDTRATTCYTTDIRIYIYRCVNPETHECGKGG